MCSKRLPVWEGRFREAERQLRCRIRENKEAIVQALKKDELTLNFKERHLAKIEELELCEKNLREIKRYSHYYE